MGNEDRGLNIAIAVMSAALVALSLAALKEIGPLRAISSDAWGVAVIGTAIFLWEVRHLSRTRRVRQ